MPAEGRPDLNQLPPPPVGIVVKTPSAREISVPFKFNRGGGVGSTTDPDVQARQHVNSLLRTIPGERVMKPTYGVNLLPWIFENIGQADLAAIQQLIDAGFEGWIPSVRLLSLSGVDGPGNGVPEGTLIISLTYTRRFDSNPTPISTQVTVVSM